MPHIVLINALSQSLAPAERAFRDGWPAARLRHINDFDLSADLEKIGRLTPAFTTRMSHLVDEAEAGGADGVLFTCSAFGDAIEGARDGRPLPVLKPDEGMIEAALGMEGKEGPVRIAGLATFAPTLPSLTAEIAKTAERLGVPYRLHLDHVDDAIDAWNAGDEDRHDALIVEAARAVPAHDVLLLAQFSMAHTAGAVAEVTGGPVLTSPGAAVDKLKRLLGAEA